MAFRGYSSRAGRERGGRGNKPNMAQGSGKLGKTRTKVGSVVGKGIAGGGPLGNKIGAVVGKPVAGGPGLNPAAPKPGLGAGPKAPMAKPGPKSQGQQPDSVYNDAIQNIDAYGESRLGELQGQRDATRNEFGIDDPTNPFSRAEGLKRAFLSRKKAASAQLASAGQLYSGAHERAISRTRQEEEQARAELRAAYEQAMSGISSAERGVQYETEEQRQQAFEDWLERAESADVVAEQPGDQGAPPPAAAAPPKPTDMVTLPNGQKVPNAAAVEGPPKVVSSGPQQPSSGRKPVGTVGKTAAGLGNLAAGPSKPQAKAPSKPKPSSAGQKVGTVGKAISGIGNLPPATQNKGKAVAKANKNKGKGQGNKGQGQGRVKPKAKAKVKAKNRKGR